MIDVSKERPEPLTQLCKIVERRFGIKRTKRSFHKWCKVGCRTRAMNGSPHVKLESVLIGGVYHSSVEAYLRFVAKCSEEA